MSKIQAFQASALSETPSTPGIIRHRAFQGDGCMVLRAQTAPGMMSGWHHHGDHDVYGYVASGAARFESESGEEGAVDLGPGDFFHVAAHTVHRESNPSSERSEIILFLRGDGPLVVSVDDSNCPG